MEEREAAMQLVVTPMELDLIGTALRYLEDTLSREEAEELEAVQALLAKLDVLRAT